jgi:hypothetical protein
MAVPSAGVELGKWYNLIIFVLISRSHTGEVIANTKG